MAASLAPLFLLILPACLIQQTISLDSCVWLRTVGDVTEAKEEARFITDQETIWLHSLVKQPNRLLIQSTYQHYDFKAGLAGARLMINSEFRCVVFPLTTNFTETVKTIKKRSIKKPVETPDPGESYTMKGNKMTDAELKDFKSKSPYLYHRCNGIRERKRFANVDETSAVTDEDVSGLDHATFISLYGKVTVYFKRTWSPY